MPELFECVETDATQDIDALLWHLAGVTAGETGEAFIISLVRNVAQALGVSFAFVSRVDPQSPSRVRVIAMYERGTIRTDFDLEIDSLPCQLVLAGQRIFVPCELPKLFPAEADEGVDSYLGIPLMDSDGTTLLGHLALLDREAWRESDRRTAVVRIFATRAEAELRRLKLEDELRRMAGTDPLTGVANRRRFMERATEEVYRAERYGHPLSLIMVDIDRFKSINDRHGHAGGDAALVAMAFSMTEALRRSDLLGRLGGEEFGILLPQTTAREALTVADKLRGTVSDLELAGDNGPFRMTISLGIAELRIRAESLDQLIARADRALYDAKEGGRDRAVLAAG